MSHHGPNPFQPKDERFKRNKLMRDLLDTTGFVGALGDHPRGKLNADDEGAIENLPPLMRIGGEMETTE